jgi:alpha-tubulin suppressor-like RCC1 family protein
MHLKKIERNKSMKLIFQKNMNTIILTCLGMLLIAMPSMATVLYHEDFSDSTMPNKYQEYRSSSYGRIEIQNGRLRMDVNYDRSDTISCLNEIVFQYPVTGKKGIYLSFFQQQFDDEMTELPETFSGHKNGDGVSISLDNQSWNRIVTASELNEAEGKYFSVSLDDYLESKQSGYFYIKFQQYDDYKYSSDGREWDDIKIEQKGFIQVDCGKYHSLALKCDGTVWAWGDNSKGQLGNGTTNNSYFPILIKDLKEIVSISAGRFGHNLALDSYGYVWGWGSNSDNYLSDELEEIVLKPVKLSGLVGIKEISAGASLNIAYNESFYWTWGRIAHNLCSKQPCKYATRLIAAEASRDASFIVDISGNIYSMGYNSHNSLGIKGLKDYNNYYTFQKIDLSNIKEVAYGFLSGHALDIYGNVYSWGHCYGGSNSGRLGNGCTDNDGYLPFNLRTLSNLSSKVITISSNVNNSFAICKDGSVYGWGNYLGNGNDYHIVEQYPIKIQQLTDSLMISGGYNFGVALKKDGTVWAFGFNSGGRLGIGSTSEYKSTPVQVLFGAQLTPTASMIAATAIASGTSNHPILKVKIETESIDTSLKSVTVKTNGTYKLTDIQNFHLIHSTDSTLDTNDTVLSTRPSVAPGHEIVFSPLSRTLHEGDTDYFFVTVDISNTAGGNRDIYLRSTPLSNIQLENGSFNNDDDIPATGPQTFKSPSVKLSSLNTPETNAIQGTEKHAIYAIKLDVEDMDAILNGLTIKTAGSYETSDISSFNLLFSEDDKLDENDLMLNEQNTVASGHNISFSGFEHRFPADNTGYLFITVDMSDDIVAKRTLSIDTISFDHFTFKVDPYKIGTGELPSGNEHTLYRPPVIHMENQSVPSGEVAQGIENYLIYNTKLTVSDNDAILSNMALMTGGTFETEDIDQFSLWLSSDTNFNAGDTKLQSQNSPVSGNSIIFSDLSLNLAKDTTYYLMVTIDVSKNAQGGNSIFINDTSLDSLVFSDSNTQLSGSLPKGSTHKFPYSPYVITAVGFYHTVALRMNGMVWTWGRNHNGQLGDGTTDDSFMAVSLPSLKNISTVVAGHHFSLAMTSKGTVWAWGENESGQLGNGTFESQYTPIDITGLMNVTDISAGATHSLALKNDGTVWAWGGNRYGQLGDGTFTNSHTPVRVSGLSNITAIACGGNFNMALADDGKVWTWGQNDFGQLGIGNRSNQSTATVVSNLNNVITIAAGETHALVILSDKTVKAWGANEDGRLGNNDTTDSLTPVAVSGLSKIIDIAAGNRHSLALDEDNNVWAWGWNKYGQLGNGDTTEQHKPVQITSLQGAVDVEAGGDYSVARLTNGTLRSWGHNQYGQLGDGTSDNRLTPVEGGIIPVISIGSANAGPETLQRGGTNELLERLDFTVTGADATFIGLNLITAGDYESSDLNTGGFKLWYSTDEIFNDSEDILLNDHARVSSGDNISFDDFAQTTKKGMNYLFITIDVSPNAIGGRKIQISDIPFTDILFEEKNCLKTGDIEPVAASHEKAFPTVSVKIASTDISAQSLSQGTENHILYQMRMTFDDGDGNLSGLHLTPAGTYHVSDLVPGSFRLRISTDNTLDDNDPILDTHEIVPPGFPLNFDNLNQPLAGNTAIYLFVTVDIDPTAGGERFIFIMETDFENIQFKEIYVYKDGTAPLPDGGRQTFNMTEITLSSPTVSASQVAQGTQNHVLYCLDMAVADANIFLYSLTFHSSGSYLKSDIDGFDLYYSTDSTLNTAQDLLMTSVSSVGSNASLIFDNLSFLLKAGETGHYFVVADINDRAIVRDIQITDFQLSDIKVSDTVKLLPDTGSLSAGGIQTFPTPSVAISSINVPSGDVEQDTQDHILYGFKFTVSNADAFLSQLTVVTNGTYIVDDISAFELKFSNDNTLDDNDTSLAIVEPLKTGSNLVFNIQSQKIEQGTSAYIFVTADIGAANGGRTLYITGKTLNDIVFDSNELLNKTGPDSFPAGGVQTLPLPDINIVSTPISNLTVEQDTANVILHQLAVSVTRAEAVLTGLNVTTAGNYIQKDLVSNSFKLRYSTDNTLDDTDTVLQALAFATPGSQLRFNNLNLDLLKDATGYLFVTVDTAAANGARTIKILKNNLNDITFIYAKKSGTLLENGSITFPIPDITVSATDIPEAEIAQHTSNLVLYKINVSPTRAEAYLTGLTLKTNGTYLTSDLVPDSFKLRISDDSRLNPEDDTLATCAFVASGGQLIFTGFTREISKDQTDHLFVTVDTQLCVGRNIQIAATALTNLSFTFGQFVASPANLAKGGIQQFTVPHVNVSSTQISNEEKVIQGTINQPLYRLNMTVSDAKAILTGLQLTTSGTYRTSDISTNCSEKENCNPAVEKGLPVFHLFASLDDQLDDGDILLGNYLTVSSGQQLNFSGLSYLMPKSSKHYIFLTANIGAAVGNRTIQIMGTPHSNIKMSYREKTDSDPSVELIGNNPISAGSIQTFETPAENVLDFVDETNDYIQIPYKSELNPRKFTVSLQAKVEGRSGFKRVAISSIDKNNYAGYEIYADTDNVWKMRIGTGSGWYIVEGVDIVDFDWYYITGVFNGSGLKLYVNDKAYQAAGSVSSFAPNTSQDLYIGCDLNKNNFFNGQLQDIHIWNKALTDTDIESIHDGDIPTDNETGIVAHYRFDPWGTFVDTTGNDHHGTINGAPTWASVLSGLWIGQIEINKVNETTKTEPQDVPNPFDMRILIHISADGTARLLKEVTLMKEPYVKEENGKSIDMVRNRLITDETLLSKYEGVIRRDGKLVGIRLTSLAFEFDPSTSNEMELNGTVRGNSKLTANLTISENNPNNPFVHKYHPDHRTGRKIDRNITLFINPVSDDDDDPQSGEFKFEGVYDEILYGAHKLPIHLQGQFSLERVSGIHTLNDEE